MAEEENKTLDHYTIATDKVSMIERTLTKKITVEALNEADTTDALLMLAAIGLNNLANAILAVADEIRKQGEHR